MENVSKWLSEFLNQYWQLVVVIFVLLSLLVFASVAFALAIKRDKEFDISIAKQSRSVRVYIVDTLNEMVTYFNVTDLKHVKRISSVEFYQRFSPDKQKQVVDWIKQIADPKIAYDPYLETNIYASKGKTQFFSMLEVFHVNYKASKVYLLSYLLDYINPEKTAANRGATPLTEVLSAIKTSTRKLGATICFRFDYKKSSETGKQINPLVFSQLKNVFSPYLSKKSYMVDVSSNEIILVDLRIKEGQQAIYLAKNILNDIRKYFSLNSLTGSIGVRTGVVMHKIFPLQGETIISKCTQFTASIDPDEEKQSVNMYSETDKTSNKADQFTSRTEVEKIIEEKKLSYQFRSIYNVPKERVVGYLSRVVIDSPYFDNIDELKDYAVKTQDDRELFATIAKNVIPKFANEKNTQSQRLFFPVKMAERPYLLKIFAYLKAKDQHIVFLYEESDIKANYNPDHMEDFVGDVRSIKTKGYEVGILVDQKDLGLPNRIYSCFDYFMVTFASAGSSTGSDTRLRAQMHALVERLLKYEKPIIASDIEGWNAIELLIRSGLDYISSDYFAPYDQMLLPVPPKSEKKIHELNNSKR